MIINLQYKLLSCPKRIEAIETGVLSSGYALPFTEHRPGFMAVLSYDSSVENHSAPIIASRILIADQ